MPFSSILLVVSGCMATGPDLASLAADRALTTASVAPQPKGADDRFSDEMTVRNAVSSTDLSEFKDNELAWTNASTGSRGVISALRENNAEDRLCRVFTTTLERYDGIALYRGEICLGQQGYWAIQRFSPV